MSVREKGGTGTGIRTPVPWLRNAAGDIDGLRLRRFSSGFRADLRGVLVVNGPFRAQNFKNLSIVNLHGGCEAWLAEHLPLPPVRPRGSASGIYVGPMGFSGAQRVLSVSSAAHYTPPGYLLFGRQDTLMAVPFELGILQAVGEPFPIAEGVGQGNPGMKFSVSETGVLAYSGPTSLFNAQLAWYSREGKRLTSVGEPGRYRQIALSPDEKRVAVEERSNPVAGDVWLLELSSGVFSRFTVAPSSETDPVWSPDGKTIIFATGRNGPTQVYSKVLGGNNEERLYDSAESSFPEHFYGDGRFVVYISQNGRAFYSVPLTGERKPKKLFETDDNKDEPHVSPDERWIAYGSSRSGRWEIYVATFPGFGDQRQLSKAGGAQPRWRKDGHELYYVAPDGKMMVVEVKNGATLETSSPKELFQTPLRVDPILDQYAVTGDGRRFLIAEPLTLKESARPMTVVLNWTADLQQKQR